MAFPVSHELASWVAHKLGTVTTETEPLMDSLYEVSVPTKVTAPPGDTNDHAVAAMRRRGAVDAMARIILNCERSGCTPYAIGKGKREARIGLPGSAHWYGRKDDAIPVEYTPFPRGDVVVGLTDTSYHMTEHQRTMMYLRARATVDYCFLTPSLSFKSDELTVNYAGDGLWRTSGPSTDYLNPFYDVTVDVFSVSGGAIYVPWVNKYGVKVAAWLAAGFAAYFAITEAIGSLVGAVGTVALIGKDARIFAIVSFVISIIRCLVAFILACMYGVVYFFTYSPEEPAYAGCGLNGTTLGIDDYDSLGPSPRGFKAPRMVWTDVTAVVEQCIDDDVAIGITGWLRIVLCIIGFIANMGLTLTVSYLCVAVWHYAVNYRYVTHKMGVRCIGGNRAIVMTDRQAVSTGLLACWKDYINPARLPTQIIPVTHGEVYRLDVNDTVSLMFKGNMSSFEVPRRVFESLVRSSKVNLGAGQLQITLRKVMKAEWDHTAAMGLSTVLQAYQSAVGVVIPRPINVNLLEYTRCPTSSDVKDSTVLGSGLRTFMKPVLDEAYAPSRGAHNERIAVLTRVVEVKNPVTVIPNKYKQYAEEFVALLAEGVTLDLQPPEMVYNRQKRGTQIKLLDQGFYTGLPDKAKPLSSFVKKEVAAGPNDPRVITTLSPGARAVWSTFCGALSDHIKAHHPEHYGFGCTPAELSKKITTLLMEAVDEDGDDAEVTEMDLSRFDGRYGALLRYLEELTIKVMVCKAQKEAVLAAHKHVYGNQVWTSTGFNYDQDYSRGSGEPGTSVFNTESNWFMSYCVYREMLFEPSVAFQKTGVYAGDDSVTKKMDQAVALAVAVDLGMKLTLSVVRPGQTVHFLSRAWSAWAWFGEDESICDVPRQAGKLHVTGQLTSVPDAVIMRQKGISYLSTDRNTPVIGQIARLMCLFGRAPNANQEKIREKRYFDGFEPTETFPQGQLDSDWAVTEAATRFGTENYANFMAWYDTVIEEVSTYLGVDVAPILERGPNQEELAVMLTKGARITVGDKYLGIPPTSAWIEGPPAQTCAWKVATPEGVLLTSQWGISAYVSACDENGDPLPPKQEKSLLAEPPAPTDHGATTGTPEESPPATTLAEQVDSKARETPLDPGETPVGELMPLGRNRDSEGGSSSRTPKTKSKPQAGTKEKATTSGTAQSKEPKAKKQKKVTFAEQSAVQRSKPSASTPKAPEKASPGTKTVAPKPAVAPRVAVQAAVVNATAASAPTVVENAEEVVPEEVPAPDNTIPATSVAATVDEPVAVARGGASAADQFVEDSEQDVGSDSSSNPTTPPSAANKGKSKAEVEEPNWDDCPGGTLPKKLPTLTQMADDDLAVQAYKDACMSVENMEAVPVPECLSGLVNSNRRKRLKAQLRKQKIRLSESS